MKMTDTALTIMDDTQLPMIDDSMLGDDVLGYSEKADDSLIPVLSILQDNSGEVKKRHERHIEGAEAGMMIIRSLQLVFPPEQPIMFQPCGFSHSWVEWTGEPGEGGAPVGQYDFESRPVEAEEVVDAQGRKEWRMPESNNRLVETRHHFGHVVSPAGEMLPVVVAMSGTNHSVSRQWTALMKQFRVPGKNVKAPAFMRLYDISTVFSQKGQQSWYKYKVKDAGWVADRTMLEEGFKFAKAVAAQEVKAAMEADAADPIDDNDIPV
jgi:hypothetical protein